MASKSTTCLNTKNVVEAVQRLDANDITKLDMGFSVRGAAIREKGATSISVGM